MRLVKRALSSHSVRNAITWLAAQYVRLVWLSGRWQIVGDTVPDMLLAQGRPFIVAFWHGRLIMMAFSWKRSDLVHMLISGHRDGQLVASMMRRFGSKTVFGSTSRGGAAAFVQLVRLLRDGKIVGITPDGPRGPRMRVNGGIVSLARISGAPIIPLTYSATPLRIFSSWDRFALPLPFGRGVFLWGEPISVERHADDATTEAKRLELERVLIDLTRRADSLMGSPGVEPAAPAVAEAD